MSAVWEDRFSGTWSGCAFFVMVTNIAFRATSWSAICSPGICIHIEIRMACIERRVACRNCVPRSSAFHSTVSPWQLQGVPNVTINNYYLPPYYPPPQALSEPMQQLATYPIPPLNAFHYAMPPYAATYMPYHSAFVAPVFQHQSGPGATSRSAQQGGDVNVARTEAGNEEPEGERPVDNVEDYHRSAEPAGSNQGLLRQADGLNSAPLFSGNHPVDLQPNEVNRSEDEDSAPLVEAPPGSSNDDAFRSSPDTWSLTGEEDIRVDPGPSTLSVCFLVLTLRNTQLTKKRRTPSPQPKWNLS